MVAAAQKRKPVSPQQYVDRALEAFGKKAKVSMLNLQRNFYRKVMHHHHFVVVLSQPPLIPDIHGKNYLVAAGAEASRQYLTIAVAAGSRIRPPPGTAGGLISSHCCEPPMT